MIVFTARNYKYESIKFAEDCVEKYCTLSRLAKTPTFSKEKRPKVFKDKSGKPCADNVCLSVSHSGSGDSKILTVAVSNSNVGIDIERVRPIDWRRISKRYFTEGEIKEINNSYDFYVKWTQKEAYYKAMVDQRGVFPPAINTEKVDKLKTFKIYEGIVLSIYTEDLNVYFYA